MGDDGKSDLKTEGLAQIAKGLTGALGQLKDLGLVGTAEAGRGFSELALSGLELGHEGLTNEFKSFCERWEWGVRALIAEGDAFAEATDLSAGSYYEDEQYAEGSFKVVTNALVGNPYASEDDVEKMGWSDIVQSGGSTDYSGKSFQEALSSSEQGWKQAGQDVLTSPGLEPLEAATDGVERQGGNG